MTNARNENKEKSSWKKALLILLCLLLLVGGTVMGTMAYLTHKTEAMENTFHVGDVKISLLETPYDVDGKKIRDTEYEGETFANEAGGTFTPYGNEYKLIPGNEYKKDPFVYIKPGSEECYIFVKIQNGLVNMDVEETQSSTYDTIFTQIEKKWTHYPAAKFAGEGLKPAENVYFLTAGKVKPNENTKYPLFNNFKIKNEATNADLNAVKTEGNSITITAYAVQASGFDNAIAAWDATFGRADLVNVEASAAEATKKA